MTIITSMSTPTSPTTAAQLCAFYPLGSRVSGLSEARRASRGSSRRAGAEEEEEEGIHDAVYHEEIAETLKTTGGAERSSRTNSATTRTNVMGGTPTSVQLNSATTSHSSADIRARNAEQRDAPLGPRNDHAMRLNKKLLMLFYF